MTEIFRQRNTLALLQLLSTRLSIISSKRGMTRPTFEKLLTTIPSKRPMGRECGGG